ncbi:MAG: HAMP domain-containing histidine kinase, partial [Arenibacter algicola]|nr:HAMP domain-containing histidine kinase [Arenibacter algicola]
MGMHDQTPVSLFDMLPTQLALVDGDGIIRFTNRAWDQFAHDNGYRGGSFEGQNYLKLCSATIGVEDAQASTFGEGLKQVLKGTRDKFELTYPCHAPGQKRWFKGIAYRSDPNVAVMHVDITEEYRQVEQLLEVINSATLIHDLRAPLNAIMGFAEFSQDLGADKIDQIHDNLGLIHKSGERLLGLVNELLAVAESRQKTAVDEKVVVLDRLLTDIVIENGPLATKAGVSVTTDLAEGVAVIGHEEALWKVFANLVTNAIKYNR